MEPNALAEASEVTDGPSIDLEGKRWHLTHVLGNQEIDDLRDDTCILQSCSAGRLRPPFDCFRHTSSVSALVAMMRNTCASAYQIMHPMCDIDLLEHQRR